MSHLEPKYTTKHPALFYPTSAAKLDSEKRKKSIIVVQVFLLNVSVSKEKN